MKRFGQIELLESRKLLSASRLTDLPEITWESGRAESLITHNGHYYFGAPYEDGFGLFRSDGSSANTQLLKDGFTGQSIRWALGQAGTTVPVGHQILFLAQDDEHGREVWITDGTPEGTSLFFEGVPGDESPDRVSLMQVSADQALIRADGRYWLSDGTATGTLPVAGAIDIPDTSHRQFEGDFYVLLNDVVDGAARSEFWKIDIEARELKKLADIDGRAVWRTPINGRMHFLVFHDRHTDSYQSDGSAEGTRLIREDGHFDSRYVGQIGSDLVVPLQTSDHIVHIVRLKPSGETVHLQTLRGFWQTEVVRTHQDYAFFPSYNNSRRVTELWVTDGTATGTSFVMDMSERIRGRLPTLGTINDRMLLTDGYLVMGTYGPDVETLADFPLADEPLQNFVRLTPELGLFSIELRTERLNPSNTTGELWGTDGTQEGTKLLKQFPFRVNGPIQVFQGKAYFAANDGVHGLEIWESDGTPAGTRLFKDIAPGPASAIRWGASIFKAQGHLLFQADDGVHGTELWQSDGSQAGTQLVRDIAPNGSLSLSYSWPEIQFIDLGTKAVFWANDNSTHGAELWTWEPTIPHVSFETKNVDFLEDGTPVDSASLTVMRSSGSGVSEVSLAVVSGQQRVLLESKRIRFEEGEQEKTVAIDLVLADNDFSNPDEEFDVQLISESHALVDLGDSLVIRILDDERKGDANNDGLIDYDDFLILSADYGKTDSPADFNFDGTVSFADFLLLSKNFGESVS